MHLFLTALRDIPAGSLGLKLGSEAMARMSPLWISTRTPIADLANKLHDDLSRLLQAKTCADGLSGAAERAQAYADQVKPHFDTVRDSIDYLEGMIDERNWTLPKYRELLFLR